MISCAKNSWPRQHSLSEAPHAPSNELGPDEASENVGGQLPEVKASLSQLMRKTKQMKPHKSFDIPPKTADKSVACLEVRFRICCLFYKAILINAIWWLLEVLFWKAKDVISTSPLRTEGIK